MACVDRDPAMRFLPCAQLVLQLQRVRDACGLDAMCVDIVKVDPVILDEFGCIPRDSDETRLLFRVKQGIYESRSLNIEFSKWGVRSRA